MEEEGEEYEEEYEEDEGENQMVAMCRNFNTVGQGAFYTESFRGKDEIHIVVDCGSLHNVPLIRSTIESVFDKGEKITAVFISHFDEDHINGLEYLLKYCSVENLFLPLMREENKALLLIHFMSIGISQHSFLYSFVERPENVVGEHTRIVYVEEFDDENFSNEEQQDYFPIDDDSEAWQGELPFGEIGDTIHVNTVVD